MQLTKSERRNLRAHLDGCAPIFIGREWRSPCLALEWRDGSYSSRDSRDDAFSCFCICA